MKQKQRKNYFIKEIKNENTKNDRERETRGRNEITERNRILYKTESK